MYGNISNNSLLIIVLGEGNGNPLQYSCLENPMGRGTWWATFHRITKSQTALSDSTHTHTHTHNLILSWNDKSK